MFVPSDVEWFIAEQIQEFCVAEQETSLVYVNSILVRASNAESAYERALELGKQSEHEYKNSEGQDVRVRCRGLRDLYPIYEQLEDRAELFYESFENQTETQIRAMTKNKNQLELFS